MKYLKVIFILLLIDVCVLCSMLFQGCYIPQKGGWYEFRTVTLTEIHKTESGYDLIWDDGLKEVRQFVADTSGCGYVVGMTYRSMMKK